MDNKNVENLSCFTEDITDQIENIKRRDGVIDSKIEDIMIDLHNNCEFMGQRMAAITELIKSKTEEEIKASTVNYRKAYDTLIKVAILIGVTNTLNILMLIFLIINRL